MCGGNIFIEIIKNNNESFTEKKFHTCDYYVKMDAEIVKYLRKHRNIKMINTLKFQLDYETRVELFYHGMFPQIDRRLVADSFNEIINPNYKDNTIHDDYRDFYWIYS